jgi:hypothetical protein
VCGHRVIVDVGCAYDDNCSRNPAASSNCWCQESRQLPSIFLERVGLVACVTCFEIFQWIGTE